jgi:hypothetical protein
MLQLKLGESAKEIRQLLQPGIAFQRRRGKFNV